MLDDDISNPVRKGVYMSRPFADELRRGCKKRGHNQSAIIRLAVEECFLRKWREEDKAQDAKESAA